MFGIHRYSGPDEATQDDLKVNVTHLTTSDGLRPEAAEWIAEHVRGQLVIMNGVATFSNPSEAIHFKFRWGKAGFDGIE